MLSVYEWNDLLPLGFDHNTLNPIVHRAIVDFLTAHDRPQGYETTQLGKALYPCDTNPLVLKRLFNCISWTRRNTDLRAWAKQHGQRKVMGKLSPIYVWRKPDTPPQAATPQAAVAPKDEPEPVALPERPPQKLECMGDCSKAKPGSATWHSYAWMSGDKPIYECGVCGSGRHLPKSVDNSTVSVDEW